MREVRSGDTYSLVMDPPHTLEATVKIDLDLQNMTVTPSKHFQYIVDGFHHSYNRPIVIARFAQRSDEDEYHFDWHYKWMGGVPGANPNRNYVYALPYRPGEHYKINQGYFGKYSHQRGTSSEYALDFGMPEGTAVCAARDGIVVGSRGSSSTGGADKKYTDCGNFITIKHSDGTYAKYFHLQPGGNIARLGQRVRKGDVIGISGHTGFADRPHLHFIVTMTIDANTEKSIPTQFETDQGIVQVLQKGEIY